MQYTSPFDHSGTSAATSWPTPTSAPSVLEQTSLLPCQEPIDRDLWFAERGDDVERAKALCGGCPLRTACLDGALARSEPWGVWGGEVFIDGRVVARKRGRGRPRKDEAARFSAA